MSTSRSGTLWLAVMVMLLAAAGAQAYQWPAVPLLAQQCQLPYGAPGPVCPPVAVCPPVEAAVCPPVEAAVCPPVEVAACPPVATVTCPPPAGPASVTTTCPPVRSYAAAPEVTTTCPPATVCPPAPVAVCPPAPVAECPPPAAAECPPACPTAPAGACPTVPAATVQCVTVPPSPPDYDCSKEGRFEGTIASFLNVPCATGESGFVLRQMNGEERTIITGPQSFMANMNFCANIGDTVAVIGAPDASGNILARQITWQGQTFVLRSDQGYALWAGAASGSFAQYTSMWSGRPQESLSGRVLWVNRYYPGGTCMAPGIEFALDTGLVADYDMVPHWRAEMMSNLQTQPVVVQLGPESAVNQMLPDLRPGQRVTVLGSSARWDGQRVVLAAQVERAGQTVAFRGPTGTPMWAGGWLGWCGAPVVAAGFDPCTLETVCGMVQQVVNTEIAPGMGIHKIVVLQTAENRMLRVDLGPQWFLQQQGILLQCGQTVTVTGSVTDIGGQPTMLATTIEATGRQFALRSDAGTPVWSVAMLCPLNVTASSSAFMPAPQAMAPPTTAVASAGGEMAAASPAETATE